MSNFYPMALSCDTVTDSKHETLDSKDYLGMPLAADCTLQWGFITDYVMGAIKHLFQLDTNNPRICTDAKLFYDVADLTIRHLRETGRCCKTTNLNWPRLFRDFMSKGGFERQDFATIVTESHDMLFHPVDPEAAADADTNIDAEGRSIDEVCMYLEPMDDVCNHPGCPCVVGED
jgi:hypothetical protein